MKHDTQGSPVDGMRLINALKVSALRSSIKQAADLTPGMMSHGGGKLTAEDIAAARKRGWTGAASSHSRPNTIAEEAALSARKNRPAPSAPPVAKPTPQAVHVPSQESVHKPRAVASQAEAAKHKGHVSSVNATKTRGEQRAADLIAKAKANMPDPKQLSANIADNTANTTKHVANIGGDAVKLPAKPVAASSGLMKKGLIGAGVLGAGLVAKKLYDSKKPSAKVAMLLSPEVAKLAYNKDPEG